MSDLRFAVIGCGFWSGFQIAGWFEVGGVELVALHNRTRSKAEALAERFSVPAVYDDPEEMLAEELRTAGYRLGGGGGALTLEVEIVKFEHGSRAKRLIGIPGLGASSLAYEATVLDARGVVLGRTEGRKRFTGYELINNPAFRTKRELRIDMANHCAAQIGKYVQTLPAADHVSTAP